MNRNKCGTDYLQIYVYYRRNRGQINLNEIEPAGGSHMIKQRLLFARIQCTIKYMYTHNII